MSYLDRTIYDDAVELVDGDRAAAYGDPNVNLENIAQSWNGIIRAVMQRNNPGWEMPNFPGLTAYEVSLMLATLKIMRMAFKPSRDNFVDANAYIGLAKMVNDRQAQHPAAESLKPPKGETREQNNRRAAYGLKSIGTPPEPPAAPTATPDSGCGNGKIPGYDDPCPKPRMTSGFNPVLGDRIGGNCFDTDCYSNKGRCIWEEDSQGPVKVCHPR